MKHRTAGFIFLILGIIFLYEGTSSMHHGTNLLGFSEMTWMWFSMAIVHFFIRDKDNS
jgi:hypothetical protein